MGFGIVLAISTGVMAFAYRTALNDVASADWVDHTQQVLVNAQAAVSTVDDMEARYEQFLLTGSPSTLERYQADLDRLNSELTDLEALTADNLPQVERWRSIQLEVDGLDTNAIQPMALLRKQMSSGVTTQQDLLALAGAANVGLSYAEVRGWFATAIDVERQLLQQRTQAVDREDALLIDALIGGMLGVAVIGLLTAIAFSSGIVLARQRDVDGRNRAQAATESILHAAAEGIWAIDIHGRVTMMNASAQAMTGFPIDEVRGKHLHPIAHHSYPNGSPYAVEDCPTRAAMLGGEVRHVRGEVFWRKDRSSFPVEYTAVPIRNEGRVTGAVVTFHDISQQLAVDRMKDEFISVVAHELKTPLTSVRGSLGLLVSGVFGPLPERGNRMLEVALSNTDRLIRLVSDIVDVESIASGRVAMNLEVNDAAELLERSVASVSQQSSTAGVKVEVDLSEPIQVVADSDRILQTLTHLISNAIKFSERGSDVQITVRRDTDRAIFSVHDHGSGIPSDKLESIFRRFEQVDASDTRRKGGTGLGLAVASTIIRQHGGDIWAESTLGEGSTFYFTLPLRLPPPV